MRKERTNPTIVVPAVYHRDIRGELLASAPTGTYGEISHVVHLLTGISADQDRLRPRKRAGGKRRNQFPPQPESMGPSAGALPSHLVPI